MELDNGSGNEVGGVIGMLGWMAQNWLIITIALPVVMFVLPACMASIAERW